MQNMISKKDYKKIAEKRNGEKRKKDIVTISFL